MMVYLLIAVTLSAATICLVVYIVVAKPSTSTRRFALGAASLTVFGFAAASCYAILAATWPQSTMVLLLTLAMLVGVLAAITIVWVPIMVFATISASTVLNQTTVVNIEVNKLTNIMFMNILDQRTPRMTLENGRLVTLDTAPETAMIFERLLTIPPGYAVVTEKAGSVGQVLGPGQHRLTPFEDVRHVRELGPQEALIEFNQLPTRDGVLMSGSIHLIYQIERWPKGDPDSTEPQELPGTPRRPLVGKHPHPVHSWSVARSVYCAEGRNWQGQTKAAALACVSRALGDKRLSEILDAPERPTTDPYRGIHLLADDAKIRANTVASEWGVEITRLEFIRLPVPDGLANDAIVPWDAHRSNQLHRFDNDSLANMETFMKEISALLSELKLKGVDTDVQRQILEMIIRFAKD